MARRDTRRGKLRAISQDNTARIQKLNQELRKLNEGTDRAALNKSLRGVSNTRKPKS